MKILKKLLLINWHYFTHQLLEFEQLNYMTGVNASGKSTIIDALQLILLGDTAGKYFNKSASGKSASVTRLAEKIFCLWMFSFVSFSPPMQAMTPSSPCQI